MVYSLDVQMKCYRVLNSCVTQEQFNTAVRYCYVATQYIPLSNIELMIHVRLFADRIRERRGWDWPTNVQSF